MPTVVVDASRRPQRKFPFVSALSEALQAANVNGWSTREIAARGGDRVAHSTIAKYLNGKHGQPREDVLELFAEVFNMPIRRLRSLAGQSAGELEPYRPPPEANRLNRRQRGAIDEVIRLLVDASREVGGSGVEAAPMNVTSIDGRSAAARRGRRSRSPNQDQKE